MSAHMKISIIGMVVTVLNFNSICRTSLEKYDGMWLHYSVQLRIFEMW